MAGLKAYALANGNVFILSFDPPGYHRGGFGLSGQRHHHAPDDPGDYRDRGHPEINPLALLVPVFASNVGGTATLIGDPPNILIGSYAGLTFGQFVQNLSLICAMCLVVASVFFVWWYKKDYLKAEVKDITRTIAYLKEEYQITNKKLMIQSLLLLGFTILLSAPRVPAHAGLHRRPAGLPGAAGHLRGGHRRDAGDMKWSGLPWSSSSACSWSSPGPKKPA